MTSCIIPVLWITRVLCLHSCHVKSMCLPHPSREICLMVGSQPWTNSDESTLQGHSQTKPSSYSCTVYRYCSSPNPTSRNCQDWLYWRAMHQPMHSALCAQGAEHIITLGSISCNNISTETSQHHALARKTGSSSFWHADVFNSCNILQPLEPAAMF